MISQISAVSPFSPFLAPSSPSPVWAVQFHPEHAGGPEDCSGMFQDYINECVASINSRGGVKSKGLEGLPEGREKEILTSGEALKEYGIYLDDKPSIALNA